MESINLHLRIRSLFVPRLSVLNDLNPMAAHPYPWQIRVHQRE